jgi:hypothetical protein
MYPFAASLALAFAFSPANKLEAQLANYPPRKVVNAQVRFGARHAFYIIEVLEKLPTPYELRNQAIYVSATLPLWSKLQNAQNKRLPLAERTAALSELQAYLDNDPSLKGRMPPIALYWRFCEGPPSQAAIGVYRRIFMGFVPRG